MADMKKVGNIKGPPGDDAFKVAQAAGFAGTKADWLASLKGTRGAGWSQGSGAPQSVPTDAVAGDLYLDVSTGDVYQLA